MIGVLADVRDQDIASEAKPTLVQPAETGDGFAVRTSLPTAQATSQVRSLVRSLDPALVINVKTMRERISDTNARRTFQTSILSGFALTAVLLALVGLYGLVSYTVKQRTPEIGIRLAIGSPRSHVLGLILSQGMRLTAYGLLLGLAASLALTRLIRGWLYEVKAGRPAHLHPRSPSHSRSLLRRVPRPRVECHSHRPNPNPQERVRQSI